MTAGALLLVEDDDTLGLALEITLRGEGYRVEWAKTLASAREAWSRVQPEFVVLDLGLPDGDGLSLCRERRAAEDEAAILILTARGTVEARVEGLHAGADDYLTKPFELTELLARLVALRRRVQRVAPPTDVVELGRLRVDFVAHHATVDDLPIELTELELRLLRYFLERRGQVVSREELLERVWGRAPSERTRTVDVFVSRLRRHIEPDGEAPCFLINVRGVGYRLV